MRNGKKHEDEEEIKEIYRKHYEKLLQQKEGEEEEEEKNSEEISERIKRSRNQLAQNWKMKEITTEEIMEMGKEFKQQGGRHAKMEK